MLNEFCCCLTWSMYFYMDHYFKLSLNMTLRSGIYFSFVFAIFFTNALEKDLIIFPIGATVLLIALILDFFHEKKYFSPLKILTTFICAFTSGLFFHLFAHDFGFFFLIYSAAFFIISILFYKFTEA